MNNLLKVIKEKINPEIKTELKLSNNLELPKIEKVVVSVGTGSQKIRQNAEETIAKNLALITGQKPSINIAKKSISGFKLREGDKVGLSVTLRGKKMYDFLSRLINITIPRIRDFRGLPTKSFDENGNYTLGIKEHTVFAEIPYEEVEFVHGMQVNIQTTAKNNEEAKLLLAKIGFPFKKEK